MRGLFKTASMALWPLLLAAAAHAGDPVVGVGGPVNALVCDGSGNLYAGGEFQTACGVSASRVARWDGQSWTALGEGLDGGVDALACDGSGNLYAGGVFTVADGQTANYIARWNGAAWTSLGTGASNGLNGRVTALACDGSGNVYAGGWFTEAGGSAALHVARWNGSLWSALGKGMKGMPGSTAVLALCPVSATEVYAGGAFTNAGGASAGNIAKWNGTSWTALSNGLDGPVYALARDSAGNLYAGGYFENAGSLPAKRIARWGGSPLAWSALGSGMGGIGDVYVQAIICDSPRVFAGGVFTTAGGASAQGVAQWDGSDWGPVGTGVADAGHACALTRDGSGRLYAGGLFTRAGGTLVNYVARWTGSAWLPLGPAPAPVIVACDFAGASDMVVRWSATNAIQYTLQWSATPGGSVWNDILPTNRAGPSGAPWTLTGTNTGARSEAAARFYRIRARWTP